MAAHKRKIKNFLLMPKIQLRYTYYLVAINAAPMAAFLIYCGLQLKRLQLEAAASATIPPEVMEIINTSTARLTIACTLVFLITLVLIVYGTIVISHRFVGPMYVINQYIKAMIGGDFETQRNLRKEDEMKETFDLLKKLGSNLKKN